MYYRKFLPVIDSDCVMNNICKYIESIDFKIKQKVKSSQDFDYKTLLSNKNFAVNKILYEKIKEIVFATLKDWEQKLKSGNGEKPLRLTEKNKIDKDFELKVLKEKLREVCSNEESLANHLVYLFYFDRISLNKTTLWGLVGKQIYENIKKNCNSYYFPVLNENGSMKFLYHNYSIERFVLEKDELMEE